MARRGENIYKRKDGRWEARICLGKDCDGKTIYRSVNGKSYRDAKKKMEGTRSSITIKETKDISPLTVKEYFDIWLKKKKAQIKESTYSNYYSIANRHILPVLGERKISWLTPDELNKFTEKLQSEGRIRNAGGLSPKTVRDIMVLLKSIMKFAQLQFAVSPTTVEAITLPRTKPPKINVLSKSEQKRLEKFLCDETDYLKMGVLICLFTGIRLGELCALKWCDISFENETLYVQHTLQRISNYSDGPKTKVIVTSPKSNDSIRQIPLPSFFIQLLKTNYVDEEAYILTGKKKKYIEPRTMENYFYRYLEHVGLRHVNFHTLRHTFATRCIESGFDAKTLSEILGHSSVNITLNRYVHSSLELKRRQMELLKLA